MVGAAGRSGPAGSASAHELTESSGVRASGWILNLGVFSTLVKLETRLNELCSILFFKFDFMSHDTVNNLKASVWLYLQPMYRSCLWEK